MSVVRASRRETSKGQLFLRGAAALAVLGLLLVVLVAQIRGNFDDTVRVAVMLSNVGDGLPPNSDVKYRGVLVGTVTGVERRSEGNTNVVAVELNPALAPGIPRTVTARVVPSNVFAVPSIQLVDNGSAESIDAGWVITEDTSLETVRLQTSLTQVRQILAAAGRSGTDTTLGVLDVLARATDGRGAALDDTGTQLVGVVRELNSVMSPGDGDTRSTLASLSTGLSALESASPGLLDALHESIVPMRTLAEQRAQLTSFLTGALTTVSTGRVAMDNNAERLMSVTRQASPVLAEFADAGPKLTEVVKNIRNVTDTASANLWNAQKQALTASVYVSFLPNRQYTRDDCQRYGDLQAASCTTGPVGQPTLSTYSIDPSAYDPPASIAPPPSPVPNSIGGNVGPVGSPAEQQQIADILGGVPNAAAGLLFGPLARGTTVQVTPPNGPTP